MTEAEALEYVRTHDDDTADEGDLPEVFRALYGRRPDAQDEEEGLWSHCCAAVEDGAEWCPHCGLFHDPENGTAGYSCE